MAPEELYSTTGNYRGPNGGLSGMDWLMLIHVQQHQIGKLRHIIKAFQCGNTGRYGNHLILFLQCLHAPWREAETAIKALLPMYKLTVDGLNQAMIKLMVNK